MKGIVQCDVEECGWRSAEELNLDEWMDADCPGCGHPLMDVKSKAVYRIMKFFERFGLVRQVTEGPAPPGAVKVRVNTAPDKKTIEVVED